MKQINKENTREVPPASPSWLPRHEAAEAMQVIREAVHGQVPESDIVETPTSVEFSVLFGRCKIHVTPIEVDTRDGLRLSERFEARTELSDVLNEFDDGFFNNANLLATTGAALRCPDTDRAVLVSGAPVFEADTVALQQLYVPTILYSSLAQSLAVKQTLHDNFGTDFLPDHAKHTSMPGCDEPSSWTSPDFAQAAAMMDRAGIFANASETGLAAEFPWEPDAVSAITGGRTSLLVFDNNLRHPSAGNGLHFRLMLPVSGEDSTLREHARGLNHLDAFGFDVPPGFGAWALHSERTTLVFSGFWPNCMYRPGTVANIAGWCSIRSKIARQYIGNRS